MNLITTQFSYFKYSPFYEALFGSILYGFIWQGKESSIEL